MIQVQHRYDTGTAQIRHRYNTDMIQVQQKGRLESQHPRPTKRFTFCIKLPDIEWTFSLILHDVREQNDTGRQEGNKKDEQDEEMKRQVGRYKTRRETGG